MKATDRLASPVVRRAGVLAGLLLCGLAGLSQVPAQGPAPAPREVVADVIIQGNRSVSTQRIMSLIRTRPGQDYQKHVVNEDVRTLLQTKQFANVQVQTQAAPDNKVVVYFLILELPSTIQEVVYKGAKHLKNDELNNLTGLRKGAPLNPIANRGACQTIVRRYNDAGRPFATCDLLEGGQAGDARVVFNIAEGPLVKVRDIRFVGNTFVGGGRLKTQITSSTPFLPIVHLIGGTYNPEQADLDLKRLEEYYKSFGYQRVRVSRDVEWSEDRRYVTLIFHIDEGERYKVAGTQVDGTSEVAREPVEALIKVRATEPYDRHKVDGDRNAIQDYYGYMGRGVTVRERLFFPADGKVVVHYEVEERPPARVGQIFVIGNETTRQNVILRQVPLFPGQVLTYPDLRVAERNLARLGIFELSPENGVRPTVSVIDPDSDTEFKDILVQVQETRTGSVLFGVGVNSDAGLSGSVVVNERNFDILRPPTSFEDLFSGHAFRGGGQDFRLEAVPGTQVQRYTATLREPFLFDSQFGLTVGGYFYTRRFDEYDETRLGSRVTLDRRLNQYWTASAGVRVENVGVRRVPFGAPPEITDFRGENFQVALRAAVSRDSRDSYLRPTEGSRLELSYEQFFGDFTFPIFNVDFNKYWTVYQRPDGSGRHVLALHTQASWAGDETPVYERFYAGGFRSLRGFRFRGVGPDINGFKVGGDFQLLNSLEYQVPVKANDQIYLVGFVDSGTVESVTEIKDYRVAAGVGVRFTVPILGPVPIALDFGFPIVKGPNDREQIFSFWLGFFR